MAPLLARGADAAALGGPLSGINALRGDQRNQVIQLVEDIAEYLELKLEPAPSFQAAIDAVVAQAAISEAIPQQQRAPRVSEPTFEPDEPEVKILALIAEGTTDPKQISVSMNLPLEKTNYHLHRLSSANMVNNIGMFDVIYKVLQPGRELLVTRGML